MKRNIYNTAAAVATTLLLLLYLLPACSDDGGGNDIPEVPETKYAKLTITLGSLNNATPAFTRATFEPDTEEANEYERHIDDWYIVVMNNGKVDRVISNQEGFTDPDSWQTDQNNLDSKTTVSMELVVGESYTFYAFANLKYLKDNSAVEYLKSLQNESDFQLNQAVSLKEISEYQIPAEGVTTNYIPMSSYSKTQEVTDNLNSNQVELLLIRLIGKVEVTIDNATEKDVTLTALSLHTFRTSGDIYLLPYDVAQGKITQNLLATSMENTLKPDFPTSTEAQFTVMNLLSETVNIAANSKSETFWSYANETHFKDDNTNTQGDLKVQAVITDRNDEPLNTEFAFIRRNDWLKIPMLLSDVETVITFDMQHMPIGGKPTSITIPKGLTTSLVTYDTKEHGGEIKISYELREISSLDNATLKHYVAGDTENGSWTSTDGAHPYTSAVLESNDNLLINVPENNSVAPWLDTTAKAFNLTIGDDGMSGSFTVTAQELAKSTSATIRLTLVIKGNLKDDASVTKTIVVPYTIKITNKTPQESEGDGNEGGN